MGAYLKSLDPNHIIAPGDWDTAPRRSDGNGLAITGCRTSTTVMCTTIA